MARSMSLVLRLWVYRHTEASCLYTIYLAMYQLSVAWVPGGEQRYLQGPQCVGCAVRTNSGDKLLVRTAHPTAPGPLTLSDEAERNTLLGQSHLFR